VAKLNYFLIAVQNAASLQLKYSLLWADDFFKLDSQAVNYSHDSTKRLPDHDFQK